MRREALKAAAVGCLVLVAVLAQVLLAPALLPLTGALALAGGLVLEWQEKRAGGARSQR